MGVHLQFLFFSVCLEIFTIKWWGEKYCSNVNYHYYKGFKEHAILKVVLFLLYIKHFKQSGKI